MLFGDAIWGQVDYVVSMFQYFYSTQAQKSYAAEHTASERGARARISNRLNCNLSLCP